MQLRLTNTASGIKEPFEPLDPKHVRMYVCGPTVYDRAHIGNARPVVVFDVLYRLLKRHYPRVTYVRNITDVDDKIIAAAKERGEPIPELTRRTTEMFHADMAALGTLRPDEEPRATQHIAGMIAMIEALIASDHAYEADGHVLFHVPSQLDYGALSRRAREDMIAGARVEPAPYKKDPADFVLWKPSTAEQPGWDSPWGRGRPGWHIECSAMSAHYLGETFDIHGGGQDLIFPHHENERAQSIAAHHGKPFVRYWVHNGYVTVNGEKMAKSEGNIITVGDLLAEWHGEVIRAALLSAHYRHPLDWTEARLRQSRTRLNRWYNVLYQFREEEFLADVDVPDAFMQALDDDLNTPRALSLVDGLIAHFNVLDTSDERSRLKSQLMNCGDLLGLLQVKPIKWRHKRLDEFAKKPRGLTDEEAVARFEKLLEQEEKIKALIAAREVARREKKFAEADRIRDELSEAGIILEDRPDGTTDWRRA